LQGKKKRERNLYLKEGRSASKSTARSRIRFSEESTTVALSFWVLRSNPSHNEDMDRRRRFKKKEKEKEEILLNGVSSVISWQLHEKVKVNGMKVKAKANGEWRWREECLMYNVLHETPSVQALGRH